MGRYTGIQERSLHFGRDDGARIAISKHIRYTLRGIDPFTHAVMRGAARNLPCTPVLLAPFAESFPFSAVSHRAIYHMQEGSLDYARDDDTGIAIYKHIRCTPCGINQFPPIPSFRAQREIFLALRHFLLPSQKVSPFPLSHIRRYTPYRHFERSEKSFLRSGASCSFRQWFPLFRYLT